MTDSEHAEDTIHNMTYFNLLTTQSEGGSEFSFQMKVLMNF